MPRLPEGTTQVVIYLSVEEKEKLNQERIKAGGKPMSEFLKGVLLKSLPTHQARSAGGKVKDFGHGIEAIKEPGAKPKLSHGKTKKSA